MLIGDPHISTNDGLTYTFNGLGHYWYMKHDNFNMQTRFVQGRNTNGELIQATVIGGFAAKQTGRKCIQVELNSDRSGK